MTEATVIIAAWNAQKTLRRSVESAVAQSDVACEIIIADDASTDGTAALAEALVAEFSNVKAITLPKNGGPAAARNAALAVAKGRWIAVLDADDAYCEGRLRGLIDFAQTSGADIASDAMTICDETGAERAADPLLFRGDPAAKAWSLADYVYGNQVRAGTFSLGYLKPIFRRQFLTDHALRYDETLHNGEDFHFVLSALVAGAQMRFQPEKGYLYTVHAGSISHRLNLDHARNLALADARFLQEHSDSLSTEAATLMRARLRDIRDLTTAETVMQALKRRKPGAAIKALIERPRAAGRLLAQLGEALRKRTMG